MEIPEILHKLNTQASALHMLWTASHIENEPTVIDPDNSKLIKESLDEVKRLLQELRDATS